VDSLRDVLDVALANLDKSGLILFDLSRQKSNKNNPETYNTASDGTLAT